jgi:hypothetical protein
MDPMAAMLDHKHLGMAAESGVALLGKEDHPQRLLTRIVEAKEAEVLAAEFEALPRDHRERYYFRDLDKNSTTWVTTIPDGQGLLSGRDFAEVGCRYLMVKSPVVRPVAGWELPGRQPNRGPTRVDAYGDALLAAVMKGGGQQRLHNSAVTCMAKAARSAAVATKTEVPNIFRGAMPPRAAAAMDAADAANVRQDRPRFGYVPDLHMFLPPAKEENSGAAHARLLEVKTILGKSRYTTAPAGARAVDTRAERLTDEYARMLHRKDMEWCGTAEGTTGPMEAVLRSHGRLRGLVFVAVGEASKDVHGLIKLFAHNMAAAVLSGRANPEAGMKALVGRYAWSLRRTVAMNHWRGLAGMLIDRKSTLDYGGEVPRWGHAEGQRAHGAAEAGRAHQRQRAAAHDGPMGD